MLKDVGSERSVLASFCQCGSELWAELYGIIEKNTFTQDVNQAIYQCLEQIFKDSDTVDLPTICNFSTLLGLDEIILKDKHGIEYLQSLFNYKVEKANVINSAKVIARLQYIRTARNAYKEAYDKLGQCTGLEPITEINDICESSLYSILYDLNTENNDSPILLKQGGEEIVEWLLTKDKNENIGIPTPWECYNAAIGGGFRRGGVNIIASRAKMGKSTISKEVILHCNSKKMPTLYLDTEMVHEDQYLRALASLSEVDIGKIERGEFRDDPIEKQKVLSAHQAIQKNNCFWYVNIYGKPFSTILSIIRRWIITKVGYENGRVRDCLVVYDYFKLMSPDDLNNLREYEAIAFQISALTDFCKEYDFACLAFAQLNRSNEISMSDRLRWLALSFSKFELRTREEVQQDSNLQGNRKMTICDTRFGPGAPDDYIIMDFDGGKGKIQELCLHSRKDEYLQKQNNGFETRE
jgi:replicative DNA helicase